MSEEGEGGGRSGRNLGWWIFVSGTQNSAPMQVKSIFHKNTGFLVFKNDVLLAWEFIFQQELCSHVGNTAILHF